MAANRHWFVTADGRRATLFWCEPTPGGKLQVEPKRTLENEEVKDREHHRPTLLGRGPSANAAQRMASLGHDQEEYTRRFAKRVAEWLGKEIREIKPVRLTGFAAPRFLGYLRGELARDVQGLTEFIEAELTRLRPHELAEHPAVLAAVGPIPRTM